MPQELTATLIICLLPLANFLILIFWGKFAPRALAALSTASLAAVAVLAGYLFFSVANGTSLPFEQQWFTTGAFRFSLGVLVDPLSTTMGLVVTFISLMVHIYSFGYMKDHEHFSRFYAFLALFTTAMLLLVFSSNFILLFIGWEGVGLCSYFLIGFYFDKPSAAAAGKKAFITTRIGDLGFLIGLLMLGYFGNVALHSLSPDALTSLVDSGVDPTNWASLFSFSALGELFGNSAFTSALAPWIIPIGLLIFCGAVGKSAQFPLHVWLPDAMEGPTPVSALIHAATMVVAGIFLVARVFFIFDADTTLTLPLVVTGVGVFTAFMAATIAIRTYDLKRILAYSTLSQLGFMMAALGLGSVAAAMFHVATHAFFKGLLFLGAGSIYHAYHSLDIREIRGVASKMKLTAVTFIIGSLALAGFPFITAGFFSKEAILSQAYMTAPWAFWVLAITAGMTSFYMFRLIFSSFFGTPAPEHHPHESPASMTMPLAVLALLAIAAGYGGHYFATRLGAEVPHADPGGMFVMGVSIAFGFGGILLAWAIYSIKVVKAEALSKAFGPISTYCHRKWYWDEIYDLTALALVRLVTWLTELFDRNVVDELAHYSGRFSRWLGFSFRQLHSGIAQVYVFAMAIALLVLIFIFNLIRFS